MYHLYVWNKLWRRGGGRGGECGHSHGDGNGANLRCQVRIY